MENSFFSVFESKQDLRKLVESDDEGQSPKEKKSPVMVHIGEDDDDSFELI